MLGVAHALCAQQMPHCGQRHGRADALRQGDEGIERVENLINAAFKRAQRDGHAVAQHITHLHKDALDAHRHADVQDAHDGAKVRMQQVPQMQHKILVVLQQRRQHESRAEQAAEHIGKPCAGFFQMKYGNQQIGKRQLAQVHQQRHQHRVAAVAHGARHRAQHRMHGEKRQRQKQHLIIPHGLVKELILRRGHQQPQHRLRGQHAQSGQREAAHQRQKQRLLDGFRSAQPVLRADLAGDQHGCARRDDGKQRRNHRHNRVGHADGRQRAGADGADDARE